MKKVVLLLLGIVAVFGLVCVYVIGGMAGVYAWNIFIFITAPLGVLATLIQVILLIIFLFKKKSVKWNVLFIAVTLVFAFPITILFGVSNITYPTKANASDEILLSMPVENPVIFGGKEYKTHAVWPSECYAYDILSEPYDTGSKNLVDYGIYNADVTAPISAVVIGVENSEADIEPNSEEFISSLGNCIFLEVKNTGTYLILSHLKAGSINVNVGDYVEEGQIIAKVGNSGTTSEPHLHIQHQRNNPLEMIYPTCAEGLPIEFKK